MKKKIEIASQERKRSESPLNKKHSEKGKKPPRVNHKTYTPHEKGEEGLEIDPTFNRYSV